MSEGTPQLHLSGTEIYQWAQFFTLISQLSARLRQRREMDGRLAHADGEHASRLADARMEPAMRPMTEHERHEWLGWIPAELRSQREESFTVWTAQVGNAWGVEANTWDTTTGTPTSNLLVACRDAEDAIDLCRWLREHQTPNDLVSLQAIAADAVRRPVMTGSTESRAGAPAAARHRIEPVLSEQEWEAALRAQLPPRVANRIIVKDANHPHHAAWRELHALANEEVWRVGADPVQLARLLREASTWRENVRKHPGLAYYLITEARTSPGYEQAVRSQPPAGSDARNPSRTSSYDAHSLHRVVAATRLRLDQVSSPLDAVRWAGELETSNPEHRIEAKLGFGRWGSEVDTVLARKFPGLMQSTHAAAERQQRRDGSRIEHGVLHTPADDTSTESSAVPTPTRELLQEVDRLDPARGGDRLQAFAMFGHVSSPEVDLALARKFGDDERFALKLASRYPGGPAEIEEAAAWRSRAEGTEQRGAANMARLDDPDTVPREDVLSRAAATGDQQTAAAQRGVAAAVTSKPPVLPPVETSRRRVR